MNTVNIYLNFGGNCREAFEFYKSVFGGEFPYVGTYGEIPPMEGMPALTDDTKNKVMHMSLPIGGGTVIMGSDSVEDGSAPLVMGNNFYIYVNTESKTETDRIFKGLSAGGTIQMPLADAFWSDYIGMFTDKFGINWMVSNSSEKQ
jgi:PhnB protein